MPVYEEKQKVNGQKRYFIRTYVTDEFGNKKQITRHNKNWIGRDGYWEAQQEEIKLKKTLMSSNVLKYGNITLTQLFDIYYEYNEGQLTPSTIRRTKDNFNLFIKEYLGTKKIFQLSTKDIMDFHKWLDNQTMTIKTENSKRTVGIHNYSISYKQSIHTTLVTILNFAQKYVGLEKNVAHIVGNFKRKKGEQKKQINFLTVDEFDNFIKYESDNIYKNFFTILFNTGMRRGELLALTYNDVDFINNEITINKSINPKNGHLATMPKTSKSNRKIKMLNVVSSIFKTIYIKNSNDEIFGLDKIKPTTLQRKCDRNCKLGNINKNIRIHDFRHSFASMCINKNVPIAILSEYLGHEDISTTLNIYSHLYPNSQNTLLNILQCS